MSILWCWDDPLSPTPNPIPPSKVFKVTASHQGTSPNSWTSPAIFGQLSRPQYKLLNDFDIRKSSLLHQWRTSKSYKSKRATVPSMYPHISLSGVTLLFILSPSNELSQKTKIATFVFSRPVILQVLIINGLMAQAQLSDSVMWHVMSVMQWPCVTSPRHAGSSHHSLPVTKHVSDVD